MVVTLESEMSSERVLIVGIIGLGHLHPRLYMPPLGAVPNTKVIAVAEGDKTLRDAFCAEFGVSRYESVKAVIVPQRENDGSRLIRG